MTRNLKALGLVVVLALAIGAMTASVAMALTPKVRVGTGDGKIDGAQIGINTFVVGGGRSIQCEVVKLSASLAETSANVSNVTPTYEKCTSTLAGVKVPATITGNGCSYTYHVGATTGFSDQYAATTDIVCPAGKSIEYHVYKEGTTPENHKTENQLCGYTVAPQTGLGSPTFTNITTSDIELNSSVSGITYKKTVGTIPNCGAFESLATYSGGLTLTGTTTTGVATTVQIVEL